MKKYLELKENESIVILSEYKAIEIRKVGPSFSILPIKNIKSKNISIKKFTLDELNGFILAKIIENYCISDKENQILINQILDNYYNYISGKNYSTAEIDKIEFQAVTFFSEK